LLAGVGLALAPPWVEVLSWLTALSVVLSVEELAIVLISLLVSFAGVSMVYC
jgi:hypothetical protein